MYRWFLLISVLMVSGCAVEHQYIKAFNGDDLPNSHVVLVKPAEGIIIRKIDSKPAPDIRATQSMKLVDYDIALLPGSHSFEVSYYDGNLRSNLNSVLTLQAEAGHRYLIRSTISNYGLGGGNIKYKISDVTDRIDCWTVQKLKRPNDC